MPDTPMNLMSVLNECKVQEKATDADVTNFLNHKIPQNRNAKCLMSCVLEKNGDVSASSQMFFLAKSLRFLTWCIYCFLSSADSKWENQWRRNQGIVGNQSWTQTIYKWNYQQMPIYWKCRSMWIGCAIHPMPDGWRCQKWTT